MIQELVRKSRSYRRFIQDHVVDVETLIKLVNISRFVPSAANLQPLRYVVCNHQEINKRVFECTNWAGYLKNWKGPKEGERPSAYIIIIGDTDYPKNHQIDAGIAAQTIMLATSELGLGGCMIASLDRDKLREIFDITKQYDIILAIAIGKPNEKVILTDVGNDGEIKYYRNEKSTHLVPKRRLDDIIHGCYSS